MPLVWVTAHMCTSCLHAILAVPSHTADFFSPCPQSADDPYPRGWHVRDSPPRPNFQRRIRKNKPRELAEQPWKVMSKNGYFLPFWSDFWTKTSWFWNRVLEVTSYSKSSSNLGSREIDATFFLELQFFDDFRGTSWGGENHRKIEVREKKWRLSA